jgi:hypothetical protein
VQTVEELCRVDVVVNNVGMEEQLPWSKRRAPREAVCLWPDGARPRGGSVGHLLVIPSSPSSVGGAWNAGIIG